MWILFPLTAAFFYTLSNTLMRQIAGHTPDPCLPVALRESVAFLVGAGIYGTLWFRGRAPWPSWKLMGKVLFVFLLVQVVGNFFLQRSFHEIGMAAGVAGSWAGVLLGAPIFSWLFLRERISRWTAFSIACVLIAVFCLTCGAEVQSTSETFRTAGGSAWGAVFIVSMTVVTGLIYSASNSLIRVLNKSGASPFLPLMLLPGVGFFVLSGVDISQHGFASFAAFSTTDYGLVILSGVANLIAFLSLIMGLRHLNVVRTSIGNASQLAMAPLIGLLVFHEPMNAIMMAGIFLTLFAILLSNLRPDREENPLPR